MTKKTIVTHVIALVLGLLGGLLGRDFTGAQKPAEAVVEAVAKAPPVAVVDAGEPTIVVVPDGGLAK